MLDEQQLVIRSAPSTGIIFSILFSPAAYVGVKAIFYAPYQLGLGVFLCALYVFIIYWACSPTVNLSGKTLAYYTLFSRRSVELASISEFDVVADLAPLLVLHRSDQPEPFSFVIRPFSKAGVTSILRHIRVHASRAQFNAISADLEQGDFASVTREALRTQNLLRVFITAGGAMFAVALFHALFR
jgi:hypothetical protein